MAITTRMGVFVGESEDEDLVPGNARGTLMVFGKT